MQFLKSNEKVFSGRPSPHHAMVLCSVDATGILILKKPNKQKKYVHRVYNKVPYTAFKRRNISERGRLKFRWSTPNEKLLNFNCLFYCQILHMPSVFIDLNSKHAEKTLKIHSIKHKTSSIIGNQTLSCYPSPLPPVAFK